MFCLLPNRGTHLYLRCIFLLSLHLHPCCIFILVASLSLLHLYPRCIFILVACSSSFHLYPCYIFILPPSFSLFHLCTMLGFDLRFFMAKLMVTSSMTTVRVNIGQYALEDGMAEFCNSHKISYSICKPRNPKKRV